MIADDVACMRDSLRTVLSLDPDIEVVGEAADGAEAEKLAAQLRPDVVIVDLEMPCCDGYECTAELTERNLTRSVIALTIHSDTTSRARARAAGARMFLPKGTPIRQLLSAVHRAADVRTGPTGASFKKVAAGSEGTTGITGHRPMWMQS